MHPRSEQRFYRRLGQEIRRIRMESGISQRAVCRDAGLSNAYLCGFETGGRGISVYNLNRLAVALGVSLTDVFRGAGISVDKKY